jgi:hypothetical protein
MRGEWLCVSVAHSMWPLRQALSRDQPSILPGYSQGGTATELIVPAPGKEIMPRHSFEPIMEASDYNKQITVKPSASAASERFPSAPMK